MPRAFRLPERESRLVITPPPRSLRSAAILLHRYVGLAMTVFLVIAGLTGSLLAFYHELDAALNPSLLYATAPSHDARPLDPFELRERALSAFPEGAQAPSLSLDRKDGESAKFYVLAPEGTETVGETYFVDPYTAEVLGSRRDGDLTQGMKNLMPFIYRLHYSLALGDVGRYAFGIVALLWTLDCFVGAYLTFPPRPRTGGRTRKSWLIRWKPAWLVRATKLFSFVFTWHRASGLWVWAMLLVFAWSSVALNLKEVYEPLTNAALGLDQRVFARLRALDEPRQAPLLSMREATKRGRELMAEQGATRGFDVLRERRITFYAAHGAYCYQVRSSRDISDRYASTTVCFDSDDGQLLGFEAPTGERAGNTVTTWLYHLHWGSIAMGGWPYRVFISLMGLAVATLSVTGVWVWWRKRSKRRAARSPLR